LNFTCCKSPLVLVVTPFTEGQTYAYNWLQYEVPLLLTMTDRQFAILDTKHGSVAGPTDIPIQRTAENREARS